MTQQTYSVEELQEFLTNYKNQGFIEFDDAPAIAQQLINCLSELEALKAENTRLIEQLDRINRDSDSVDEPKYSLLTRKIIKLDKDNEALKSKVEVIEKAASYFLDQNPSWPEIGFDTDPSIKVRAYINWIEEGQRIGRKAREALSQIQKEGE